MKGLRLTDAEGLWGSLGFGRMTTPIRARGLRIDTALRTGSREACLEAKRHRFPVRQFIKLSDFVGTYAEDTMPTQVRCMVEWLYLTEVGICQMRPSSPPHK